MRYTQYTYHKGMNVLINPLSAFLAKAKVEEIVSHPASHRMATHDDGETAILLVHPFYSFHRAR